LKEDKLSPSFFGRVVAFYRVADISGAGRPCDQGHAATTRGGVATLLIR